MSRTLVVCIDGTWNAPGQIDKDAVDGTETRTLTNVAKTWQAITGMALDKERPHGTIGDLQSGNGWAIYLNGVGSTGTKLGKLYEGASGTGTSERIRDAYRFLAERWTDGDKIYGFGFSRGAFAIRSLSGFIETVGLPKKSGLVKDDELYDLYGKYKERSVTAMPSWNQRVDLEFLGIWDTVGALAFGNTFNNYHNISPRNVNRVFHALALDEFRSQFFPDLFISDGRNQRVLETWFAGAHTNVGGGYVDENLSNIALFWILNKANVCGLKLNLPAITGWYGESVDGVRRPSYNEFWGEIPAIGELVERVGLGRKQRVCLPHQFVHESVIEAMTNGYCPNASVQSGNWSSRIEAWGV
mgnify:CR=1 FL=1